LTKHAKLTIRNVARKAGVSVGTVSRVLNRNMSVHADIRQRVDHAIEALGLRSEFRRAQHV
jgi:LacI family transcriptional regulator